MSRGRVQLPAEAFAYAPPENNTPLAGGYPANGAPGMPKEGMPYREDKHSDGMERLTNPELIKREIGALIQSGALPEGFDIAQAAQDQAFVQLLVEMPAQYAVRVYLAEKRADEAETEAMQKISARLRSRGGLPKAARADTAQAPTRDYKHMSSNEFLELERQFKDMARNGIRAKL